jgi:8-oxo-dGTP pyrophosphatase MutT (NUDIX family)
MSTDVRVRHAVRVLLLDEADRLLLFRAEDAEAGSFWFPVGGGLDDGEDAPTAAAREVAEETGLKDLALGAEVWTRRHVFTWRGVSWDQRERWYLARVAHFEPDTSAMTDGEKTDLTACRWWSVTDMEATTDRLTPRDLAARLRILLADGPPPAPIEVGI